MKKVLVTFQVFEVDLGNNTNNDSHSRQFEFKGSFEDAKKFLDDIMSKKVETQNKEGNGNSYH